MLHTVDDLWGTGMLRWFAIAVIVVSAALAAFYVYRRLQRLPWSRLAWLLGIVAIFVYLVLEKMKAPSEALHFIEYGLLGLLALRALSHRLRDHLVYVCAVLVCLLVGTLDEILQWMTPGRFWDVRDIAHNGVAALMAQVAVAGGLRPPFIQAAWSPRSVRWFCALSATLMILLGCCASNTPVAVAWYGSRVPGLAFLLQQDHPMSEFGFRHDDPALGRFYSRFQLDDLSWMDYQRGEEAGQIIAHYWNNDSYSNFLQRYTPASDPFVHEANVHVFRRNHYRGVMWKHRDSDESYRRHVTIAYRENQILERFFPHTLAAAGQVWPEGDAELMKPFVNTSRYYKSEVSRHLITHVNERQIWKGILIYLILDILLLFTWGRERARPPDVAPA